MDKSKILFIFPVVLIIFTLFLTGSGSAAPVDLYADKREDMVSKQIESRGIEDLNVLNAMKTVERHEFVPQEYRALAYRDRPLSIGYGQTISQPYIVALMTELLKIDEKSRVLEVGTGSGYQAAVLSEIAEEVFTVEIVKPLYKRAKKTLDDLGYKNTRTDHKDGYFGWEEYSPYDAIIVTCASEFIPPPLIKQLKPGGVMCIPVGPPFKVQQLVLVKKDTSGDIEVNIVTHVRFVPLTRKGE
jgi:protein-L-isoaspartate(D-aspartate) O-methyltransferase